MINYQVNTANQLLVSNVVEAKAYCEQWVHDMPHSFDALHFCGLVHAKLREMPRALDFFVRALIQNPNDIACHNNLSNVYLALGDTEKSLQHLHQALRIDPQHPEAYNNFGRLLYKQGRISDAIPHFRKALRLNPDYWEAHYNLAHSLASLNQMNSAADHYREVIRLVPEHPIAHFNLGLACLSEENMLEAEEHLKKALELMPDNLEAAKQLAQVYVTLGKITEAIQTFEICLTLSSDLADVQHNLAILYLRNQDRSKALQHFEKALELDPKNETAKHMVLALSGAQESANPPLEYISQLFDQYADYYDEHVKQTLKYGVPGLLRNAVGRCLTAAHNYKVGRILDLGCGTGQCGVVFRDLAVEMIGVDVSSKMVEKAKQLGAYEKLYTMDIQSYLTSRDLQPFDIILAGDVLVYSGDLKNIFKMVSKALLPNGRFAFTTEYVSEQQSSTYYLQPTGRYAHASGYIHRLAEQFGFTIECEETIVPREHEGEPIHGQLYVLCRELIYYSVFT